MHHQVDLAREALAEDGFPVWCVDGYEGDDLIASGGEVYRADGRYRASGKSSSPAPTKTCYRSSVIASKCLKHAHQLMIHRSAPR